MDGIVHLLERLRQAAFTGRLELRFLEGEVTAADLHHALATAEFTRPLPAIEAEPEFTLEP